MLLWSLNHTSTRLILWSTLAFTCPFNLVMRHPVLEFAPRTALRGLGKSQLVCEKPPHSLNLHAANTDRGVRAMGRGTSLHSVSGKQPCKHPRLPVSSPKHLSPDLRNTYNKTNWTVLHISTCVSQNTFSVRQPKSCSSDTSQTPSGSLSRRMLFDSFIHLAAPGLSCGTWALVPWPGIGLWGSRIGSLESQPLSPPSCTRCTPDFTRACVSVPLPACLLPRRC